MAAAVLKNMNHFCLNLEKTVKFQLPVALNCYSALLAHSFFNFQGQPPSLFSVNLVFNQSAVKPAGLDRFFPGCFQADIFDIPTFSEVNISS